MSPVVLLSYYCLLILLASIAGGMIPVWFQLTHRGMELAVSFVAGAMLGVGLLHMLPHAVQDALAADAGTPGSTLTATMWFVLAGVMVMFFIERFFCYHHHDVPDDLPHHDAAHGHSAPAADHVHDLSWSGATLGLALHSVLNGVALGASVEHGHGLTGLAGLGTFLVVFLHKPFDAMTIAMLMARGHWSLPWRHAVNGLFALAVPAGVMLFHFGVMSGDAATDGDTAGRWAAYALAFSAGTFLCISLSDLLPELQFHQHDRGPLSLALLLGLAVAIGAAQLESAAGGHRHPPAGSSHRAAPAGTEQRTAVGAPARSARPATSPLGRPVAPATTPNVCLDCLTLASVVSVEPLPCRIRMDGKDAGHTAGRGGPIEKECACLWPSVRGKPIGWGNCI